MKNKTSESIDTLHSNFNRNASFNTFIFSVPSQIVFTDSTYGWNMFVFDPPILPGEEFSIDFTGSRSRNGFSNNGVDRTIIEMEL